MRRDLSSVDYVYVWVDVHFNIDDLDVLLTFFDFPAEHWIHLKSTNPISVNRPREARLAEAA